MNELVPLVALLGTMVIGVTIGGVIIGVAVWRLAQRVAPLERAVAQTAHVLNDHLGEQRVALPTDAPQDTAADVDPAELEAYINDWTAMGGARPWEDS